MVELERDLEKHFTVECRRLSIMTLKIRVIGRRGWPDRLIACRGALHLAELKTVKGELSPLQEMTIRKLALAGVTVPVLRTKQQITDYLEERQWSSE